jgi:hypothetical protein
MHEITAIELLHAQVARVHGEARSKAQCAVLEGYTDCCRGWDPESGEPDYMRGYELANGEPMTYSAAAQEVLKLQDLMRVRGDAAMGEPITESTFDGVPF